LTFAICHFVVCCASAKEKLPSGLPKGEVVNDLPAPYDFQASLLKKSVVLSWQWDQPVALPRFESFGFEVSRNNQVIAVISKMGYSDLDLAVGTFTYTIRARGDSKQGRKLTTHVSDWAEPATLVVSQTCEGYPSIKLKVEPTKRSYIGVPALRIHLAGDITLPRGCTLATPLYHIDDGSGSPKAAPLEVDSDGHFDELVNVLGPEEEVSEQGGIYTITVTADDEAGTTTSSAYTLDLQHLSPFAPRQGLQQ
jgi:hypothetical protein